MDEAFDERQDFRLPPFPSGCLIAWMVPYFSQPEIHLFGRITLHAYWALVALAVIVGWVMTVARCRKNGLDPTICNGLLASVVLAGFVVAHLYSVLAYYPGKILQDPVILLKFWMSLSSFGGIIGGVLGLWLYFRVKGKRVDADNRLRYLDAMAYVFPFAWTIGRLGCTLAHDHPGTVTTFPLGVSLATRASDTYIRYFYKVAGRLEELPDADQLSRMGFHDLGWYEFLFTGLDHRSRFPRAEPETAAARILPAHFPVPVRSNAFPAGFPAARRRKVRGADPRPVRRGGDIPRRSLLRIAQRHSLQVTSLRIHPAIFPKAVPAASFPR